MAKCAICEKGPHFGNAVSHSHRRSNKVWNANVKSVKVKVTLTVTRQSGRQYEESKVEVTLSSAKDIQQ